MIQEIDPSKSESVDLVAEKIERKESIEVFYPLWNGDCYEYGGTIEWKNEKYDYNYGGHGIGNNHKSIKSSSGMIELILSDNERFNRGEVFHIKTENRS